MKKTSVIALNLKSVRIPLLTASLLSAIIITSTLCSSLPPVSLSPQIVDTLVYSTSAFKSSSAPSVGVFSLLKQSPGALHAKSEEIPVPENIADASKAQLPVRTAVNPDAKVEISNSTGHDITAADYLETVPAFLKEDFSVLILHTHTTESYTPSEKYSYVPTDTDRTTDKEFNMVRVGDEIEKVLTDHGIKVYHDTTMNDYPSYNGSYNRSNINAENYIKNDSGIKIILDVHRDAIVDKSGNKIKYTTEIEGETAAKVMLVVGSNLSGLKHERWEDNMRFAVQLQKHALSLFPTLCRPINFRSQRFNQQLAPGAIIVEVGTNGNTLDEAIRGAHYFAESLADFIKTKKAG